MIGPAFDDDPRWGIYVHVPWCRRRCPYCAFYIEVERNADFGRFADSVMQEFGRRADPFLALGPPETLFFGGGTPSRMPPDQLARLIGALGPTGEVTCETNPEDASAEWLAGALRAGVTRISLGVQTFEPKHARVLNRACSVEEAQQTLQIVAATGFQSWSVDLIFGLPGQTPDELDRDLDAILACGAPHVSLYGLTVEEGTPLERAVERGQLVPVDEDGWRSMIDRITERLAAAGYERYEVSNFAKPGHRSAHNRLYWTDRPYLGLGPSANGYGPDGSRWKNAGDALGWLDRPDACEMPTDRQSAIDLLIGGIRGVDGVDLERMWIRTGLSVEAAALADLVDHGLVAADSRVRLIGEGWAMADGVTAKLVDGLTSRSP